VIEVLGVGAVGRWHGVAGKGFLGVHPAAFDQIGVDSCPRVHVMVGVVHVLMNSTGRRPTHLVTFVD